MGMGYAANYGDVIEWEEIKKLCPKEARNFKREIDKTGAEWEAAIHALDSGKETLLATVDAAKRLAVYGQIEAAFESLNLAFQKKTKVGDCCLELNPRYHDPNYGDRYDDVTGSYFHVSGVYQLTPAGKKFEQIIERKFFVNFG